MSSIEQGPGQNTQELPTFANTLFVEDDTGQLVVNPDFVEDEPHIQDRPKVNSEDLIAEINADSELKWWWQR